MLTDLLPWLLLPLVCKTCMSKKELELFSNTNLLIPHLSFINGTIIHLITRTKLCCVFGFFTFLALHPASNPSANPVNSIFRMNHSFSILTSPTLTSLVQATITLSHELPSLSLCLHSCSPSSHPHPYTLARVIFYKETEHFALLPSGLQWLLTSTTWKMENSFHGCKVLYFSPWLPLQLHFRDPSSHLFHYFNPFFIILSRTCYSSFISGILFLLFHLPGKFFHQKFT